MSTRKNLKILDPGAKMIHDPLYAIVVVLANFISYMANMKMCTTDVN